MGIRRRGRGVPTYDPSNMYYAAGLLLCFTFGMMLAGISESVLAGDWIWFWFFVTGEVGLVVLYFLNVWWWLKLPDQTDDYDGAYDDVWSDYGYDNYHEHPGHPG